jgi:hypothetical protein
MATGLPGSFAGFALAFGFRFELSLGLGVCVGSALLRHLAGGLLEQLLRLLRVKPLRGFGGRRRTGRRLCCLLRRLRTIIAWIERLICPSDDEHSAQDQGTDGESTFDYTLCEVEKGDTSAGDNDADEDQHGLEPLDLERLALVAGVVAVALQDTPV